MAFWKTETNVPQTFASLIRGLQHSVNSAMDILESRNVEMLTRFFDEEGRCFAEVGISACRNTKQNRS